MTEQQFDERVQQIEQERQRRREGADAYRDQELSRLFGECGWSQERIARQMGKKQRWVSYRLTFGRFLSFSTSGSKSEIPALSQLTERRFREYWNRTTGKEPERFAAVLEALESGIPHGVEAIRNPPGILKAVASCLEDGKWYTVGQITATVEEELPGVVERQVQKAIQTLCRNPGQGLRLESKKIGRKCQYRLTKARAAGGEEKLLAVYEQVKPLLDELNYWGGQYSGCIAPGELKIIAHKIEKIFDALFSREKA